MPKVIHAQTHVLIFQVLQKNLTGSRTIIFWLLSSWTVPLKLLTFHFSLDIHITLLHSFWADTSHACTHPHKNSATASTRKLHELKIVSHIWEHCLRYYFIFLNIYEVLCGSSKMGFIVGYHTGGKKKNQSHEEMKHKSNLLGNTWKPQYYCLQQASEYSTWIFNHTRVKSKENRAKWLTTQVCMGIHSIILTETKESNISTWIINAAINHSSNIEILHLK